MVWKQLGLLGLVLLFGARAYADVQINESRLWAHARTLNPGQQVFSVQTDFQNISDRFSSGESVQPFGQPFSRQLSWGALLKAEGGVTDSAISRFMTTNHLNVNDLAAVSQYHVNLQQTTFTLNWKYGLTRSWTIGVQVPVRFTVTKVVSSLSASETMTPELLARVRQLAQADLAASGYRDIVPRTDEWTFGDVNLINEFSLMRTYSFGWAVQQFVRFPTSRNPDLADYIRTSADEGQIDLGLTALEEWRLRRWTLGSRLGVVSQLPDTVKLRVDGDSIDTTAHRDLGDWLFASADADYRLTSALDMDLEYAFLTKSRDQFSGTTATPQAYQALGEGTDQRVHQSRVGLNYRISTPSARSGIRRLWVASLGYTVPWIGANTLDASRASFELISYF